MPKKTSSENQALYHIDSLELGPMENFIYLIQDLKTKRAAVVDPAWDVDAIEQLAKSKGVKITDILLTHSHHDHINGIEGLLKNHDAQLHSNQKRNFGGRNYKHQPCIMVEIFFN